MTTAAQTVTRNAPETNSRKTQVTVSRAIHVLSTEDQPRQVMTHRDRTCRNLESRPVVGAAEQRATGSQNNQSMTTSGL
ncbi:MAG: hypothetical protein LW724_12870 [Planctomycetaceae bacterium]|nr:hypothetical protein [Planctomycetaceae bacterium]